MTLVGCFIPVSFFLAQCGSVKNLDPSSERFLKLGMNRSLVRLRSVFSLHSFISVITAALVFPSSAQDHADSVTTSTLDPVIVESNDATAMRTKRSGSPWFRPAAEPDPVRPVVLDDQFVGTAGLLEEVEDGAYGEPEWVDHRRFSTTRVYIQKDPWEVGIEEWYRVRTYDSGRVTQRFQQEVEIGLPNRMQLDLYEKVIHDNFDPNGWTQDEFAVELRYAFADWGVLPGNPTLYEEYAFAEDGADVLESKILFGDDCEGWHWGVNLIHEQELTTDGDTEWAASFGLSRTIIDSKLSLGIEGKRTHPEGGSDEYILGPSAQWLPTENTHLDLVVLAGLNDAAPETECWLIFGFDFGRGGNGESRGYNPTSVGGGI